LAPHPIAGKQTRIFAKRPTLRRRRASLRRGECPVRGRNGAGRRPRPSSPAGAASPSRKAAGAHLGGERGGVAGALHSIARHLGAGLATEDEPRCVPDRAPARTPASASTDSVRDAEAPTTGASGRERWPVSAATPSDPRRSNVAGDERQDVSGPSASPLPRQRAARCAHARRYRFDRSSSAGSARPG